MWKRYRLAILLTHIFRITVEFPERNFEEFLLRIEAGENRNERTAFSTIFGPSLRLPTLLKAYGK